MEGLQNHYNKKEMLRVFFHILFLNLYFSGIFFLDFFLNFIFSDLSFTKSIFNQTTFSRSHYLHLKPLMLLMTI